MPRLKLVIGIASGVGENETVFVAIGGQPLVTGGFFKISERGGTADRQIDRRAQLMFRVALISLKLVGRTRAVDHRVV